MTIVASGALSLGTAAGTNRSISGEFGGSTPHALGEYYAGGANDPPDTGSIPTSGEIQFSDFFGTSDLTPFILNGRQSRVATATAGAIQRPLFRFNDDGTMREQQQQDLNIIPNEWLIGHPNALAPDFFEFIFTLESGAAFNSLIPSDIMDGNPHILGPSGNTFFQVAWQKTGFGDVTKTFRTIIRQAGGGPPLVDVILEARAQFI